MDRIVISDEDEDETTRQWMMTNRTDNTIKAKAEAEEGVDDVQDDSFVWTNEPEQALLLDTSNAIEFTNTPVHKRNKSLRRSQKSHRNRIRSKKKKKKKKKNRHSSSDMLVQKKKKKKSKKNRSTRSRSRATSMVRDDDEEMEDYDEPIVIQNKKNRRKKKKKSVDGDTPMEESVVPPTFQDIIKSIPSTMVIDSVHSSEDDITMANRIANCAKH